MAKTTPRITVRFEGDPADKGDVRLPDFAAKVTAFFRALEATEELLPDEDRDRVYYKIVELSKSSPATITVEIVARKQRTRSAMVRRFASNIRDINAPQHRVPSNANPGQIAALAALTPTTATHLAKVVVIPRGVRERKQLVLSQQKHDWMPRLEPVAIEEHDYSYGSISGRLDWINVHDNANRFYLYPRVGPRISCSFAQRVRPVVETAVGKYVRVYGRLKFHAGEDFPRDMDQITEVDMYEPDETLPRFSDLRDIAPDATGGISIRDFVESLHDDAY
jgi:hypothetical protein